MLKLLIFKHYYIKVYCN